MLSQRLRELSFLNAGLRINIKDERSGKQPRLLLRGRHRLLRRAPEPQPRRRCTSRRSTSPASAASTQRGREVPVAIEIALQYNETYNESVYSFANNINTVEGGTHLIGFRTALTRTLNRYIASHKKNGKDDAGGR